MPATQLLEQAVAPVDAKVSKEQLTQAVEAEAPEVGRYRPVEQARHVVPAKLAWKVPAGQSAHVVAAVAPVVVEYLPATQATQLVKAGLAWWVPAEQLVQALEPDDEAYFPAAQAEQKPAAVAPGLP